MRCLYPRTVGFKDDGKTISWSPKTYSKEYPTFQLPCSKCIECRLQYARDTAIRCVHEAQMHENNCFITLTYSDENLKSPRLIYRDFQLFMKKLRKTQNQKIGCLVTGEYGDKTKRPHWHALLFNYRPSDALSGASNDRGDQTYTSSNLDALWGHNDSKTVPNVIGEVTLESAGYCARYAAKKLIHGKDEEHDFHPIHKRSSKHAIGKTWLEQYWRDAFNHGYIILNNQKLTIPRYYEKWLKKHEPQAWLRYVTETKQHFIQLAEKKSAALRAEENKINNDRLDRYKDLQIPRNKVREAIINGRFKRLQQYLKGEI